jgi:tRNA(Ile)-lysidine synthase TilS/MesJ
MPSHEAREVQLRARDAALASDRPLLLAVSGGLDSMSLLDAMSCAAPERIAAVATFDKRVLRAMREVGVESALG